jgi:hypothetical protein
VQRARGALLVAVAVAVVAAACGGGPSTPAERLQSALDSRVDNALDEEGYGNARHVRCRRALFGTARFRCTADVLVGQAVFRETYVVVVRRTAAGRCWVARQVRFGLLTGRHDAVTTPLILRGCLR